MFDEDNREANKFEIAINTPQYFHFIPSILGREKLKDKWDALKTEIANFEQNQESGDGPGVNNSKDLVESNGKEQVEAGEIRENSNDCMTKNDSGQTVEKAVDDTVQAPSFKTDKPARKGK